MKIAFNTMMKNEEVLLESILPIWKKYPVDVFIFYDDNSTDSSISVIEKHLESGRYIIVNDNLPKFNEGYHRQKMIDVSRDNDVDVVFSLDCDELLTSTIVNDFDNFLKIYESTDLLLYWYNSVNGSISKYRNDSQYTNNFRSFVLPLKHTSGLDTTQWKYHTPRTPHVNLPKRTTREYGVIHLQSINTRFYVIKQLWYKHHELVNYGHSVAFVNNRYDPVVNQLNFNETEIDPRMVDGISFDPTVYDGLEKSKGYHKFIMDNYNEELVTFGKEYLTWKTT